MKRHLTFIVFLAALVAAAPAAADVTVEGTGEPAYTNSTGNTQWIRWQAPAAADTYRLHARYYRDNVQVSEVTWSPGMSGTAWLNSSGVATLEPGSNTGSALRASTRFPTTACTSPMGRIRARKGRT